jgi:hypothetical protein
VLYRHASNNQDSIIGLVTRIRVGRSGVWIPVSWCERSSHFQEVQTGCKAHPTFQWAARALSLELEGSGREADHSPPSTPEVKYECVYMYLISSCMSSQCVQAHLYHFYIMNASNIQQAESPSATLKCCCYWRRRERKKVFPIDAVKVYGDIQSSIHP